MRLFMDLLVAAGGGNRPGAQAAKAAPDRHLSVKCLGVGCSRCGIVSSSSPGSRPAPFGWPAASPGCGRRGCGPARSSRSGGVPAGGASADVCCLVEDVVAGRLLASRISMPTIRPSSQSRATNPSTPSGVAARVVARCAAVNHRNAGAVQRSQADRDRIIRVFAAVPLRVDPAPAPPTWPEHPAPARHHQPDAEPAPGPRAAHARLPRHVLLVDAWSEGIRRPRRLVTDVLPVGSH